MDISSVTLCRLLKNEAFAKFVFSLIPIAISFTSDKACQRILHNSEAAKIYRLHEWEGYGLESSFNVYHKNKLLPPEGMPIGISMWENKLVSEMELDLVWPDGVKKIILVNSAPLLNENKKSAAVILVSKDITEYKKPEQALRKEKTDIAFELYSEIARFDRLDLIGEMAASFAHEIRNPLATIKGFLQLYLMASEDNRSDQNIEKAIEEINNINSIVSEFLQLARKEQNDYKDSNINEIIRNIYPLLKNDGVIKDIRIELNLDEGIPQLYLNQREIHQLLFNLVRNGIEAMSPGKALTISTYIEGRDVVLSVKDQGVGIAPENYDSIGESFFTTKQTGTGIGLFVCYKIARKHNAKIFFTSRPNETIFFVKFQTQKSLE